MGLGGLIHLDFFIDCPKLKFIFCYIETSDAALPVTENHCVSSSSIKYLFNNNSKPLNFTYPKRKFAKRPGRLFNLNWFKLHPWLLYFTLLKSVLDNWSLFQELWEECLETNLEREIRGSITGVK